MRPEGAVEPEALVLDDDSLASVARGDEAHAQLLVPAGRQLGPVGGDGLGDAGPALEVVEVGDHRVDESLEVAARHVGAVDGDVAGALLGREGLAVAIGCFGADGGKTGRNIGGSAVAGVDITGPAIGEGRGCQ